MDVMEAPEVGMGTIHDVKGPGLGQQPVQDVHVMRFSGRDINERGDIPA